jgi:hypothetical protein
LKAAQEILLRCGAVSYGMYQLSQRFQASRNILEKIPLADPAPVREIVIKYIRPLVGILKGLGVPIPPEIQVD